MRFLHTADWHLGKKLRTRSRLPEQERALQQIADAAVEHRVDAVLVAGDLFDSTMPPPEAEQIAFAFLGRLSREGIPSVVIAGNHDHPQRFAALAPLLEGLRIHLRPEVKPAAQGGIVELRARAGDEVARIAVLPFVPERKVIDAALVASGTDQGPQRYQQRLKDVMHVLAQSFRADTVNVLLAHVLVSGARFGTGERQLHLGEIWAVQPEDLPAAQYCALGHLHRPQEIPGAAGRTAYSGSLVELDFGERDQQKRAVLVDCSPGLPAQLTDVPLTAGRRLRDVRGTLAELEQQRAELGDAFLRVTCLVAEPSPGIEDKVRAVLPEAVEVRQEWPRAEPTPRQDEHAAALRAPMELFADFHRSEQGAEPSAAMLELFDALHREADREDPAP